MIFKKANLMLNGLGFLVFKANAQQLQNWNVNT